MRELRPKPVRLNSSQMGLPALPAQKDDGLAAIMARRRQAADSSSAVQEDPFVKAAQRAKAATLQRNSSGGGGVADNDLLAAMQRRRQHVESGSPGLPSPRQSRPKLSSHRVPVSPDLMDKITSRAPLQHSPRTGRDAPDRYRHHPVVVPEVERALTQRFGSLDSSRNSYDADDETAEFQSARAGLAHVPLEAIESNSEEEEEEEEQSNSSHEPLISNSSKQQQQEAATAEEEPSSSHGDDSIDNLAHLAVPSSNNDYDHDSFVTDYTAADASAQQLSYAESHAARSAAAGGVQRTDSGMTDESSVTNLIADVLSTDGDDDDDGEDDDDDAMSASDHSQVDAEPSQSSQSHNDNDDDDQDDPMKDDHDEANNRNNSSTSHHTLPQNDRHMSYHSGNYYYTTDEEPVAADQHHSDEESQSHRSEGEYTAEDEDAAAMVSDRLERQYSGDSANHMSNFTTGDETIDLLDVGDDGSYSSNEFPEHGEEFSTDDGMDYYTGDDEDGMTDDDDGFYTSDDQEPYYTSDGGSDGDNEFPQSDDDMPGDGDDSFYEEETYYSTPQRGDSFMTEQTVESVDGGDSYYSAPPLRNASNAFSVRSMNTIGTLGTLSEEGTVDLEEEESESQNEEGGGSIYEEQTVYTSGLGGRSVFGEHAIIEEGDEDETSTATGDKLTEVPSFHAAKNVFEKTKVEADSSFYSTNGYSTGRSSGATEEEVGLGFDDEDDDEHFDDFNVTDMNRVSNNSYDAERSILGTLSVLDAVPEESTCHESQLSGDDKSIDESTIFGTRLGDEDDDAKGQSGPLPSRLTDSTSIDIESGYGSRQSLGDRSLEQAPRRPRRGKRPVKKKKKKDAPPKKVNRFCTFPWLIAIVLAVSLGVGVIVGIIIFGGKNDENPNDTLAEEEPVPAPDVTPDPVAPSVETRPDLPEEKLKVYDLICSALDDDCELLLDISSPQGQAFEWLINDQMANPELETLGEERQIRRYALATFYHSTDGASWANRLNWLSDRHECQWFSSSLVGSGCSDGETFDTLELNNNNLRGEIPREIFLLASLKSISFINPVGTPPFLKGSLPSGWRALTSLASLTISGNQFSGSLTEELGKLTNLESLDLSYNGFNGEIPSTFSFLSKIKSLNLAGNMLFGNIDEIIFQGAKALVSINLARNRLTGVPSSIVLLTELRTLNLASNKLADFPYEVTSLTKLTTLDLQGNGFTNEIPFRIGKMVGLQSLNLSNNKFSSEIPVEIGKLVELSELLDLSNNELSGPIPTTIGSLVKLQRLLLNGNQLQGDLPVELAALTLVKEVRYDENNFTGFVPDDVCTLYNQEPSPTSYADCEELILASCFTYCCTDGVGCLCRFEKTDPLRCVKGLQR